MINQKLEDLQFVVFDIETTGLSPQDEQIIEIGAVKINAKGEKIDTFHKFISLYDNHTLSDFIINLTNIDNSLLDSEGEEIDLVMEDFLYFIEGSILVAQNSKFDMGFIEYYYLQQQIYLDNIAIDTIDLAKFLFPNKSTYKLAELVNYFAVDYDPNAHHRADYDAEITSDVFAKALKMLNEQNITAFADDLQLFNLTEASIKQKRFLFSLLEKNEIVLENKCYLSKVDATRKIDCLLKVAEKN